MSTVTNSPVAFTSLEEKLVRMILDGSASPGEIENAGRALISSWRKRGLMAETLLEGIPEKLFAIERPRQSTFQASDMLMPFGRHRGWPLHRIKRRYLSWVLSNCADLQPELERAIRAVLYE